MVNDDVNSLVMAGVGTGVVVIVVGCLVVVVMGTVVWVVVEAAVGIRLGVLVASQGISPHSQQSTLIS